MEYYESFDCYHAPDMNSCALRVLDEVPNVNYVAIQSCMKNSGGVMDNTTNSQLQVHLDMTQNTRFPFTETDLPLLRLAGQTFSVATANNNNNNNDQQDTTMVHDIFQWICNIFQEKTHVMPMACTFCGSCTNVPHCLWFLECDERPFQWPLIPSTGPTIVTPTTTTPTPALAAISPTTPITETPMVVSTSPTTVELSLEPTLQPSTSQSEPDSDDGVITESEPSEQEEEDDDQEEEETAMVETDPTTKDNEAPGSAAAELPTTTQEPSLETVSTTTTPNSTDTTTNSQLILSQNMGLRVSLAVGGLVFVFLVVWGYRRYIEWHSKARNRSAEAYVDDLLDASYKDNLQFSGRLGIEHDRSDRDFEEPGLDESYIFPDSTDSNLSIRRRGYRDSYDDDDEDDTNESSGGTSDESKVPPPFYSFKVHQVLG